MSPLMAVTATARSCTLLSRLVAVTITSSIMPTPAACSAQAGVVSAVATAAASAEIGTGGFAALDGLIVRISP